MCYLESQGSETGIFTPWEDWTECSVTCGGGRRARKRECNVDSSDGFVRCTGELMQVEDCNTDPCPGMAI